MNWIYIAGRGHSGTTILDGVLGNSQHIESVGELVSGLSRFKKEKCSCGKLTLECSYWQKVLENYERLAVQSNNPIDFYQFCDQATKQAHIKEFLFTLFSKNKVSKLTEENEIIREAITQVAGKPFVLDSSKEPTRALLLSKASDNLVIHLVKHPVDVVASTYFRIEKGNKVKFLRHHFQPKGFSKFLFLTVVSISWSFGNLLTEIIKLVSKRKVMTIKYEDFMQNSDEILKRIGGELDVDFSELLEKIDRKENLYIGHNVGGNHFRFNQFFKLDPKRKSRKMSKRYGFWVRFLNWPMMLAYGYNPLKNNI